MLELEAQKQNYTNPFPAQWPDPQPDNVEQITWASDSARLRV